MLNMLRQSGPSPQTSHLPAEQQVPDPVAYIERFGAFGGGSQAVRDFGFAAFVLSLTLRAAWAGDHMRVLDLVSMLLVVIEQTALDGGDMSFAQLYMFLPDPPMEMLTRRHPPSTIRQHPRLADQNWTTSLLAYLTEQDSIAQRRAGLGISRPPNPRAAAKQRAEPRAGLQEEQAAEGQQPGRGRGRRRN